MDVLQLFANKIDSMDIQEKIRMKNIKTNVIFIICFWLFISIGNVQAGTTGKIVGKVTDAATGEAIVGANVQLVGTYLGAATDGDGTFLILQIPPGTYTLEVSFLGYQTRKISNISVNIDLTSKVNVKLSSEVLQSDEIVEVIADKQMIRKDMTATQSVTSKDEIANLPVQEFSDVVKLQAGVVQGRDGGLHIRGGRTSEVSYMVDGVQVSDVFSGNLAVDVENSSVQELQVISGTFNAEYGRAMSGIVNIVTRDGGSEFTGSVSAYSGDYISSADNIFPHISKFDPLNVSNLQFTLGGPVPFTNKNVTFFLTGRYLKDDGYIMGTRIFNPTDISDFRSDNPDKWKIEKTGDGKAVPMQPNNKWTLHAKLSYRFNPQMRITSSLLLDNTVTRDWKNEGKAFTPENQFHDFYHFLLNPDGASKQYRNGLTWLTSFNHTLNPTTFYTVNFSLIRNQAKSYVYENPFDKRYLSFRRLQNISYGNAFFTGGVDPWHSSRTTRTFVSKIDFNKQWDAQNLIKAGVEFRQHKLNFEEFKIIPAVDSNGVEIKPFKPAIPPRESPFNNHYTHNPREFSFYIQDKLELDYMIVNLGLRYDYFDPNADVPTDLGDPGNPEKRKRASAKGQFSPRLGLAYPISDSGVLHFSYGYFFQMPLFQYLYANSEFEVQIGRLKTLMGNADLKPQKTIIYEVGFQQQIGTNLAMDFTLYYKDIRELLGTKIYELSRGADRYARYINRDFGNTRGFVLALNNRANDWFSASLDYTFQIAEGNASEPNAAFINQKSKQETEKHLIPLDWDQRHTINGSITLTPSKSLNLTLLGRYGSGLPYTPVFLSVRRAFPNTGRSRPSLTFDLKTQYNILLAQKKIGVFLKVLNIFDTRNENIVYNDTGRAGYTIATRLTGSIRGVNTLDDFFKNPAFHFAPPREILIGFNLNL